MATANLLESDQLRVVDQHELRLLLDKRFGGPGQTDRQAGDADTLCLPVARDKCRVMLVFRDGRLNAIQPGAAFNPQEWAGFLDDVVRGLRGGPSRTGRQYSFSGRRVLGSWRGVKSGVQILPPHPNAPRADIEFADHPFMLEFPIQESPFDFITNHRWIREHCRMTLLLNVLLRGGTTMQQSRDGYFWASIPPTGNATASNRIEWVQRSFVAPLGLAIVETLSAPAQRTLVELPPDENYSDVVNHGTR